MRVVANSETIEMAATALFYICSFWMGNTTYLSRCRIHDEYCCGPTCCYKQPLQEPPHLLASWHFWGLVLVVLVVFGCIVLSCVLGSFKHHSDIRSWTTFAGTAFNHLATTITGKQGIIQPKLQYQDRPVEPPQHTTSDSASTSTRPHSSSSGNVSPSSHTAAVPEVSASEGGGKNVGEASPAASAHTSGRYSRRPSSNNHPHWIEIQLRPLNPAYKSSWSGNTDEMRLAASTQVFFPPGFINTS